LFSEATERNRLVRGVYSGHLPFPAAALKRGRIGNLIGATWASLYIISDRFGQFLEAMRFTGWRTFPAVVQDNELPAAPPHAVCSR